MTAARPAAPLPRPAAPALPSSSTATAPSSTTRASSAIRRRSSSCRGSGRGGAAQRGGIRGGRRHEPVRHRPGTDHSGRVRGGRTAPSSSASPKRAHGSTPPTTARTIPLSGARASAGNRGPCSTGGRRRSWRLDLPALAGGSATVFRTSSRSARSAAAASWCAPARGGSTNRRPHGGGISGAWTTCGRRWDSDPRGGSARRHPLGREGLPPYFSGLCRIAWRSASRAGAATCRRCSIGCRARRPARVVLVLSNRADAGGLERARRAGVPAEVLSDPADASEWITRLGRRDVDLLVLAGLPEARAAGRGREVRRAASSTCTPRSCPRSAGPGMYGQPGARGGARQRSDESRAAPCTWWTRSTTAGAILAQRARAGACRATRRTRSRRGCSQQEHGSCRRSSWPRRGPGGRCRCPRRLNQQSIHQGVHAEGIAFPSVTSAASSRSPRAWCSWAGRSSPPAARPRR